ncbi:hypothetical protein FRB93_004924 [Tulasnella sp. JGI-2019a]|nr:hypothetical protein FRB93_004924 [Tulasnella sp. JGI-2019a]
MLRGLYFSNHNNSGAPERIDLFHGIAPRLRELMLHQISLKNWDSPFLFNLRELFLSELYGPTMQQLLAILEACSCLERLDLLFVHIDDNTSASESGRTINLLGLDRLTVCYLSRVATDRLLQTIQAPSCRDFSIHPLYSQVQGPHDIVIGCIHTSFHSFLTTAGDIRVTVSSESYSKTNITATGRNGHITFNTQLQGYSPHSVWSIFIPLLFPETPSVPIELTSTSGDLDALLGTSAWALHGV